MIRYKTPPASDAHRRQRAGFARWFEVFDCQATAWGQVAEYETRHFSSELAEFRQRHPQPTLKAHMLATAGQPR